MREVGDSIRREWSGPLFAPSGGLAVPRISAVSLLLAEARLPCDVWLSRFNEKMACYSTTVFDWRMPGLLAFEVWALREPRENACAEFSPLVGLLTI